MSGTTYNGWTNYATWRVNLELCDDTINAWVENGDTFRDIDALISALEDDVDNALTGHGELAEDGAAMLAISYARAFLDDVNYYEIAEHALRDNPGLLESDEDDTDEEDGN